MRNRMIELETRVAFQEETIEQLSQVINRQQQRLDRIEQEMNQLEQRLAELRPSHLATPAEETPPPHY